VVQGVTRNRQYLEITAKNCYFLIVLHPHCECWNSVVVRANHMSLRKGCQEFSNSTGVIRMVVGDKNISQSPATFLQPSKYWSCVSGIHHCDITASSTPYYPDVIVFECRNGSDMQRHKI